MAPTQEATIKYKIGEKLYNASGNWLKVMAIVDGYVMARWRGAMPFCESVNDFNERIKSGFIKK